MANREPSQTDRLHRIRERLEVRSQDRKRKQQEKNAQRAAEPPKEPGFIRRTTNAWWDRLLGAASDRSFSDQKAAYAAHRTDQDYIWNTLGQTAWGIVFPLLTIVVTQLLDVELAGMFSLAFVTATLLMIIANYGVRTFQVSDIDETHSFTDYQVNRWLTCIAMMVIGILLCMIRGYQDQMFMVSLYVYLYKMIDGLADVYEGRLQQKDKLYLAGVSQMIRSIAVFLVFTVTLFITRNLVVASLLMVIAAAASFVLYTFPLALLETPKSARMTLAGVGDLFKQCFPLFVALFLYSFIDNMPKFMMDGMLPYENQLYFNALYFPAQAILLTVGFIYKPLLVRMANAWADPQRRKRFDLFIIVVVLIIAALTALSIVVMGWIGIPIISFLYGIDFQPFEHLSYVMLVAGGITGVIDFLYQVITVMRKQKVVTKLYAITFLFALAIPWMLIRIAGLQGAVVSYVIIMAILLVLLVLEYISSRVDYWRHPENDPTASMQPLKVDPSGRAVAPEPSSKRASSGRARMNSQKNSAGQPQKSRAERVREASSRAAGALRNRGSEPSQSSSQAANGTSRESGRTAPHESERTRYNNNGYVSRASRPKDEGTKER